MCTHPMFGPDSGKGSWAGLKFMYEKVRIGTGERRQRRVNQFLQVCPRLPLPVALLLCLKTDVNCGLVCCTFLLLYSVIACASPKFPPAERMCWLSGLCLQQSSSSPVLYTWHCWCSHGWLHFATG